MDLPKEGIFSTEATIAQAEDLIHRLQENKEISSAILTEEHRSLHELLQGVVESIVIY